MSAGRVQACDAVSVEIEPVLEALLGECGTLGLQVAGRSMEPAIVPGDQLFVAPFLGLPRPGQIVLIRRDGVLMAHRLIDIEITPAGRLYRLKGDAEDAPPFPVRRQDLLGRITEVVRQGRRLPIDESPKALRRALLRLTLRRRRRRPLRGAAVVLLAAFGALRTSMAAQAEPAVSFAPPPDCQFAPGDVPSPRIRDGQKFDEARALLATAWRPS